MNLQTYLMIKQAAYTIPGPSALFNSPNSVLKETAKTPKYDYQHPPINPALKARFDRYKALDYKYDGSINEDWLRLRANLAKKDNINRDRRAYLDSLYKTVGQGGIQNLGSGKTREDVNAEWDARARKREREHRKLVTMGDKDAYKPGHWASILIDRSK